MSRVIYDAEHSSCSAMGGQSKALQVVEGDLMRCPECGEMIEPKIAYWREGVGVVYEPETSGRERK